jgi:hypothetical protein
MTPADDFSDSNLTYMDWANKMVAEGKMTWAENQTEVQVVLTGDPSLGWRMKNFACGKLKGNINEIREAQKKFCKFLGRVESEVLEEVAVQMARGICEDNESCVTIGKIAMKSAGWLNGSALETPYCYLFWDDLYQKCGDAGGTAELLKITSHHHKHHSHHGHFSSHWYPEDSGATCPADTAKTKCERITF